MTHTKTLALIVFMLTAAVGLPAGAATLPDHYPSSFNHSGSLDRVDTRGNSVVISDVKFLLANDLRVHTPDRSYATLRTLRLGTRVGVSYATDGKGTPFVIDIWVLPQRSLALPPIR